MQKEFSKMILFIHGFGSSGHSFKAAVVREYFKKEGVLSPSLSYVPKLAIDTLKEIIEFCLQKDEKVYLLGSSLGGYYATYLSEIYSLKVVLINPAVNAHERLNRYIPRAKNYFDDTTFEWTANHVKMLLSYDTIPTNQKNILLMLQKGDEVLDFQEALEKFPDANLILEDGGAHHFDKFERHLEVIEKFFEL